MNGEPQTDYVKLHQEFLDNHHFFMFDEGDDDEKKLMEHKLTVKELLYIGWARHIYRDVVLVNKSKILGIGGTHRSGKSIWACTMGYIWDPTFFPRLKQRVVHTPQAFKDEVRYVKDNGIHGAVFVIDEGGVVVPSDSFYEEWYKELNQAIQVMGYLNPIIIFCAVIRDNIGAKFRKLYNIQCKAKRFNNDFSKIKIFDLNYDDLRGKTTPKRPYVRIFGKKYIMNGVKFGRPPKFIEDAYKALSVPIKNDLLNKLTDEKKPDTPKGRRDKVREEQAARIEKQVPEICGDFIKFQTQRSKPGNIRLDPIKIQGELKVSYREAQIIGNKAEERLNSKKV